MIGCIKQVAVLRKIHTITYPIGPIFQKFISFLKILFNDATIKGTSL